MRGIREETLIQELNKHDPKSQIGVLLYLLIESECKEINSLLPVNDDLPEDKEFLFYWDSGVYMVSKLNRHRTKPTHYQELPPDPIDTSIKK